MTASPGMLTGTGKTGLAQALLSSADDWMPAEIADDIDGRARRNAAGMMSSAGMADLGSLTGRSSSYSGRRKGPMSDTNMGPGGKTISDSTVTSIGNAPGMTQQNLHHSCLVAHHWAALVQYHCFYCVIFCC